MMWIARAAVVGPGSAFTGNLVQQVLRPNGFSKNEVGAPGNTRPSFPAGDHTDAERRPARACFGDQVPAVRVGKTDVGEHEVVRGRAVAAREVGQRVTCGAHAVHGVAFRAEKLLDEFAPLVVVLDEQDMPAPPRTN